MNFYASSLFPERCDRLLFVIVTMPESVHLHDYSIPVDDMDNHLGTWSLLRLFPTFSCNRPPDNRITHAGGGKGDRHLVIPCQDSKKEPHHFTQWANKLAFNYRTSRLCLRHSRLKRRTQLSFFTHTDTLLDSLISSNIPVISKHQSSSTTPPRQSLYLQTRPLSKPKSKCPTRRSAPNCLK